MLMQYTPSQDKANLEPDMVDSLNPHDGESMDDFKERLQNTLLDSPRCTWQYYVTPKKSISSVQYYPQNISEAEPKKYGGDK